MDLSSSNYFKASSFFASNGENLEGNSNLYGKTRDTLFSDTFSDPLCKLNLTETSEFVKSLPMAKNGVTHKRFEAPSTPGRPVFSFNGGNLSRKSFPSKWDNAEKWLISSSCHDSPAHSFKASEQCDNQKMEVIAEKSRVSEKNVSKAVSSFNGVLDSSDVLLKDKFTDNVQPIVLNFRLSEPSTEGFQFRNSSIETMKDAGTEVVHEVRHKDTGTEMTPRGSSKTSRCHTPFKSSSPARHNTPANMSGPLAIGNANITKSTIDISELQEWHLAKLQLGTQYDSVVSNWSSREEEEEDVSKSLRHFETGDECPKSMSEFRAAAWQDEEMTKSCLRYQRAEAKIQAWLNLQNAKAEAQSRKLEVKIQKMRSNLEEKIMKRMGVVHRKAEELRAAARQQHSEQIQKAAEQMQKMMMIHHHTYESYISGHSSCGCFPCNNH